MDTKKKIIIKIERIVNKKTKIDKRSNKEYNVYVKSYLR